MMSRVYKNSANQEVKMESALPIEECAKQRLQALVYAYTLFTKNLMEEEGFS